MSVFRLSRWLCHGGECFYLIFALVQYVVPLWLQRPLIGTAISFSLGKWYGPVLSLSLLEDYDKASRYFEASIRNMAPISPVLASMVDRALKYGSQGQEFKSICCSTQIETCKYIFIYFFWRVSATRTKESLYSPYSNYL